MAASPFTRQHEAGTGRLRRERGIRTDDPIALLWKLCNKSDENSDIRLSHARQWGADPARTPELDPGPPAPIQFPRINLVQPGPHPKMVIVVAEKKEGGEYQVERIRGGCIPCRNGKITPVIGAEKDCPGIPIDTTRPTQPMRAPIETEKLKQEGHGRSTVTTPRATSPAQSIPNDGARSRVGSRATAPTTVGQGRTRVSSRATAPANQSQSRQTSQGTVAHSTTRSRRQSQESRSRTRSHGGETARPRLASTVTLPRSRVSSQAQIPGDNIRVRQQSTSSVPSPPIPRNPVFPGYEG